MGNLWKTDEQQEKKAPKNLRKTDKHKTRLTETIVHYKRFSRSFIFTIFLKRHRIKSTERSSRSMRTRIQLTAHHRSCSSRKLCEHFHFVHLISFRCGGLTVCSTHSAITSHEPPMFDCVRSPHWLNANVARATTHFPFSRASKRTFSVEIVLRIFKPKLVRFYLRICSTYRMDGVFTSSFRSDVVVLLFLFAFEEENMKD